MFAKAPVPGEVKTRLVPPLTNDQAAELYRRLVNHTLATATNAKLCPVELWCTPTSHHVFFEHCHTRYGVTLHSQQGDDLGIRMLHAFADALQRSKFTILIGTDCPELTHKDLASALGYLQQGFDAVLNPALDGGYVLIGLRQTAAELFTGIDWGTGAVLEETRTRLRRLGWKWLELKEKRDLDRPEDLERIGLDAICDVME